MNVKCFLKFEIWQNKFFLKFVLEQIKLMYFLSLSQFCQCFSDLGWHRYKIILVCNHKTNLVFCKIWNACKSHNFVSFFLISTYNIEKSKHIWFHWLLSIQNTVMSNLGTLKFHSRFLIHTFWYFKMHSIWSILLIISILSLFSIVNKIKYITVATAYWDHR